MPLAGRSRIPKALRTPAVPGLLQTLLPGGAGAPPPAAAAQTPVWWKEAVFYHIFLPGFMDADHDGVGELAGVLQRLPYLSALGVNALWLSPFVPGGEGLAVRAREELSAAQKKDFDALLLQAHQRGMRVVLGLDVAPAQNPPSTPGIAALEAWATAGVDGFVLAPMGAAGTNLPLQELRAALPAPLLLAGALRAAGPEGPPLFGAEARAALDMLLDAGHLAPLPKPPRARLPYGEEGRLELPELKRHYLNGMAHFGADGWRPLFLENDQLPRIVSRLGAGSLYRAILAKLLAILLLTLRGTPIVYQGQELGLPNTRFASVEEMHDTVAAAQYAALCESMDAPAAFQKVLATAAAHARMPMPWAPGPCGGFTGAVPWMRLPDGADYLNAAAQMEDKNSVWRFYQRLLALRKAMPCLVYGSFNPVFAKSRRVFCYFRMLGGAKCYVEMNLTEHQVPRPGRILRSQKLELSNYELPAKALRAYEANIYRCE